MNAGKGKMLWWLGNYPKDNFLCMLHYTQKSLSIFMCVWNDGVA